MTSFWKHSLTLAMVCLIGQALAQQSPRKKEDRQGRLEHEYNMYKNPLTKKVPGNIRQKELQFVQSQRAGLDARLRPQSNGRTEETQTWTQRGPFNQGGRTKAIGIDARNESIILAGGTSGGMYRTTDSGASWSLVSNSQANPAIVGVAQDPLNQDTWYYITGEVKESVNTNQATQSYLGAGVFKSADNGVTWTQLASTAPENTALLGQGARADWQLCNDIAIDPIDGAVLVANIGGIYRSADGGTSWTEVLDAAGDTRFGDVVHLDVAKVDASNRVYYAGTHSSGTNSGFFRSTDGSTWSSVGVPSGFSGSWERIRVSIAPSNTDVVWFLAHGDALSPASDMLIKYQHTITTWTDRSSQIPTLGGDVGDFNTQGSYNMVMRIKPDDENTVFIGDTKLWRSTDGFTTAAVAANTGNTTWIGGYSPDNDVSSYPNHHPDVHELVFFPSDPKKVLCGHDGGLSMTTDITASDGVPSGFSKPHPVTWTILNNGLYTTQAYAISIDPATEDSPDIVAGFQDNGNFRTTNISGTSNWNQEPYGGDGAWNAVAPGGDIWYISQQNGLIERNSTTVPNGPGVNPSGYGSSSTNTFISPFILDRNDANIMYYAAKKELWRNNTISTVNVGGAAFNGTSEGWTNLTFSATLQGNITALETSVTPANILYVGTSLGKLYKIADAHTGSSVTLTDVSSGLSTGFISSIDVDPDNADHVYVTFSNYEIISIFRSTDAGATWTNISGNLEENVDGSGAGPAIRWIHVFKKKDFTNVYLVGATTGLYSTSTLDGTSTAWTQEGPSTIGNVPVSMIRSRKVDGYVAIGTHGKGMFSANIFSTTDVTPPTIVSTTPADDAVDINLTANLTITFSETVADGGGSVIIKKTADDAIVESILVSSALVSIVDEVVTINPTANLETATGYYIEIESNAFEDIGRNDFAGISDKTTWNFTANTAAPVIVSSIPTDDAVNVGLADDLTITFSENVVDAGGSVIIKKEADDSVEESILVSSANISIADAVVTINPTEILEVATAYYVEIEPTAFMDEGGSNFAGIADKTTWNFTTTTVAGVEDQLTENKMKVTVFDRGINLEFLDQTIKYAEINVYGMDGKMATYTARSSFKNNNVNVKAQLTPGIYIVKASTAKGLYTQKFLVSE